MFIALYITDSKNSLIFQYLLGSNSPLFSHLLARIRTVCPSLLSRDDDNDSPPLFHCCVAKDLEIYKYHSQVNNLNYYCLASGADSRPQTETFTFLQLLDQTLLKYFDKDQLTVNKIINNYDRITMIFYMCINSGEPCVGSLNSNRIKRVIPIKSDLSKMINHTAHTLQRAVRQPRQGILASTSENLETEEMVPWRSSNLKYPSDEIYVDIIETIHVIYQAHHRHKSVQMVTGTINGQVNVKSYLSGNPTVEMDIDLAGNELYAPSLHECVEMPQGSPSSLYFIPPDGICNLLNYTIDLDMNPKVKATRPVGLVSVVYKDGLGLNHDEFEIHVNISNSPSVPHIQDLKLQIELQPRIQELEEQEQEAQRDAEMDPEVKEERNQLEDGKIKVLRNTHGRFDNSVHPGKGTWIFDSNTPVGSLPMLRGCVEDAKHPVRIKCVGVSYTNEGLLPSGIGLRRINVRSPTNLRENNRDKRLFKGVKYVCRTGDFEIRS
ncbi:AP-3 complex subunit mu [Zygosaccharomyces mellis]|uniref:AP-3 complex subunit mu n=1 Tax=Zygosaccharomyces mellis TaxID=42258 RepID=A0A4C2EDV4_9SACH|nr:AP-3 complex subunit mu [Zygosaccharomyces mellis]